jgi:hypothetical protein
MNPPKLLFHLPVSANLQSPPPPGMVESYIAAMAISKRKKKLNFTMLKLGFPFQTYALEQVVHTHFA